MEELTEIVTAVKNWKLTLAYDGTDYSGWQVQPGACTIQGELQAALGRTVGESPLPQGSGRTDAGVHALGQVASFFLRAPIPADNLRRALNRTLPAAIRILDAKPALETFHARHSAVAKTYEYRVFREMICPPALARYVLACSWPLNLEKMQSAARLLEGEHDFLSFAATDPDLGSRILQCNGPDLDPDGAHEAKSSIRTIFSSTWERQKCDTGEMLFYRVKGSGFLHYMVRNLVGTLIDVGRGRTDVEDIPKILAVRSRAVAGPTAPAQGLFLHSVEYSEK